jgi:hypothetical protein
MPGLTLEELPALVMSTVHGAEAEPHVFAEVHMLAGSASSQAYLLFACAGLQASNMMHDTMSVVASCF